MGKRAIILHGTGGHPDDPYPTFELLDRLVD
jgi:hypothetical protein